MSVYKTELEELDAAARANLSERGVRSYEFYKRKLQDSGDTDIEMILRGWIWDEIESEDQAQGED